YSLEKSQIVSHSDGGNGYSAERFQEAFSQSELPLLHQLDAYHIQQAVNRAFGYKKSKYKDMVREGLEKSSFDDFTLSVETYESTHEDEKSIEKVAKCRSYIVNHWDYISGWRKRVDDPPEEPRALGAMESHQRLVSFRM